MKPTSCKHLFSALAAVLSLGLLAGCGGESLVADGGIRGTGSSVGPVSGFGSVFVNGVKFSTDGIRNEKVDSNDYGVETEGDLRKGMILRIEGEWRSDGSGSADSMEYDDTLRGTVSNLALISGGNRVAFEIHGQKVFADRQTVFRGVALNGLNNGHFVRVSAWRQPNGEYRASYIESLDPNVFVDPEYNEIEIEGSVDADSVETGRFKMNGVTIRFDEDSFGDGLSAEDLQPGEYFEVEGKQDPAGAAIIASSIQFNDFRRYRPAGEEIEIAGPVSSYSAAQRTFGLNGLTVQITDSTEWEGIVPEDLQEGLLVQVEGESVSGGSIRATEIEIRDGDAEAAGMVGAVDPGANTFTLGGIRVVVTSRTIITDDEAEERLTIYDLIPGENNVFLEVAGLKKTGSDGNVYLEAVQVERESSGDVDQYEIEGMLAKGDLAPTTITMLGVAIVASDAAFDGVTREELANLLDTMGEVEVEVTYKKASSGPDVYEALDIELD